MARFVAGVALGLALGVFNSAYAEPSDEVQAAAADAGVDATDLEGALGSLADAGIPTTPAEYLCSADGLLCPPTPAVTHAPIPPPAPVASVWDRLAQCESSGNWHANTGNGFAGGLQFTPQTWRSHGGVGSPARASRAQQIAVAQRVLADQGWRAWPECSRRLGLR